MLNSRIFSIKISKDFGKAPMPLRGLIKSSPFSCDLSLFSRQLWSVFESSICLANVIAAYERSALSH